MDKGFGGPQDYSMDGIAGIFFVVRLSRYANYHAGELDSD